MPSPYPSLQLSKSGCEQRQFLIQEYLKSLHLDAVLISDPRHVHYLTGYWIRTVFSPVVLIEKDGPCTLIAPLPVSEEEQSKIKVDQVQIYGSNHLGTIKDHQLKSAYEALNKSLGSIKKLGSDLPLWNHLFPEMEIVDFSDSILSMRRCKDIDELDFIKQLIQAVEKSYQYAKENLKAGISEVDLFAGIHQVATEWIGEPIGDVGNDFQIGGAGGLPRRKKAIQGEMAILDLTIEVHGYRCDMCRSFSVGSPSDEQLEARDSLLEVFEFVEKSIRPGVRCKDIYEEAYDMLDVYEDLSFPHHLGHGIGINQHEAPRINPHWNDQFEIGDVFTIEPGLYGDILNAGIRIEEIYHVTEDGIDKMTQFPTELS